MTLDLDDAVPLDVVQAYYSMEYLGALETEARVSSSGEGIHVRAWFPADMSDEAVETLRRSFGDHVRRIELDETHHLKPKQMLFTKKPNGGEASPWRTEPSRVVVDLRRRSGRFSTGWSL